MSFSEKSTLQLSPINTCKVWSSQQAGRNAAWLIVNVNCPTRKFKNVWISSTWLHVTFRVFSKTKTATNYGNARRGHLSETRWKHPQDMMLPSVKCHFQKIGFHHSFFPYSSLKSKKRPLPQRSGNSRFIGWQVTSPKLTTGIEFNWNTRVKKLCYDLISTSFYSTAFVK